MGIVVILIAMLVDCESGCDSVVEYGWGGEHGDVFVCDTPCTKPDGSPGFEWCWNGTEAELEALKGDECRRSNVIDDRLWPALVGCAYGARGKGANAHCGQFVPPKE